MGARFLRDALGWTARPRPATPAPPGCWTPTAGTWPPSAPRTPRETSPAATSSVAAGVHRRLSPRVRDTPIPVIDPARGEEAERRCIVVVDAVLARQARGLDVPEARAAADRLIEHLDPPSPGGDAPAPLPAPDPPARTGRCRAGSPAAPPKPGVPRGDRRRRRPPPGPRRRPRRHRTPPTRRPHPHPTPHRRPHRRPHHHQRRHSARATTGAGRRQPIMPTATGAIRAPSRSRAMDSRTPTTTSRTPSRARPSSPATRR